jgi:hypothetical protein
VRGSGKKGASRGYKDSSKPSSWREPLFWDDGVSRLLEATSRANHENGRARGIQQGGSKAGARGMERGGRAEASAAVSVAPRRPYPCGDRHV